MNFIHLFERDKTMLSKFKQLTNDMIIFSVLLSDFEKPDFKSDALAGVRSNYFNSHCNPQKDTSEVYIDSDLYKLSYSMKSSEPLNWKVSRNGRPYQSVKRLSDGLNCVIYYEENGIVSKRIYFDSEHYWLRTDYYDRHTYSLLRARVYPRKIKNITVLIVERFSDNNLVSTEKLFPSKTISKGKSTALVYSNVGMLWYDASFCPDELKDLSDTKVEQAGFDFKEESFVVSDDLPTFDITKSEYLTDEDISYPSDDEFDSEDIIDEDNYSAYDKIERILIEAHKSNKNIFGEVVNGIGNIDELLEQDTDILTENNNSDCEQSLECVSESTETAELEEVSYETPDIVLDEATKEAENLELVNAEDKNDDSNKVEIVVCETSVSDSDDVQQKPVAIKSGKYLYYGTLDSNGKRTGKGRTVNQNGITSYEGDYSEDNRQGFGVCYYKNGSINYVGDWANNSRNGCGAGYRLSDGTMHAGNWLDNAPDGYGARFNADGSFIDVCSYSNGVRSGKSVSFDDKGNVIISVWENGEKVSEHLVEV